MSIQLTHRFLVFPLLLLSVFLALFAGVEWRKRANDERIHEIVNAPILERASALRRAIGGLEGNVDLLFTDVSDKERLRQELSKNFDKVLQEETLFGTMILNDALSGGENVVQHDKFHELQEETKNLAPILSAMQKEETGEAWAQARRQTDLLVNLSRDMDEMIEASHQREASSLLQAVRAYEKKRTLLSILVLFSGIALFLSLLDSASRYRRNAERALATERYNAIFAAALQTTRVGVLIRDMAALNHPVVFINDAFTRMTGYALADVTKSDSSEFLFGWNTSPTSIVSFRRAISLQETATFDLLIYRKDGSPFWSEWHLSPVVDSSGRLTHFVSLFTDTNALRQTQDALIQAKQAAQHASAVKTNFLAMMSHEIRTPINGILGVLKLVEETPLDEEQRHLVGIARTSSTALHGIINDILDYAKMEAGKIDIYSESFSLVELTDNIAGLFQSVVAEKGLSLQFDLPPDLPKRFLSDVGRIRQVLLNLVSNAIKFTDHGFVRLRVLSLLSQEVGGSPGLLLRFEVQDTGIGISPEDQGRLFQEFSQIERSFTRRFGGTGLGLAISKRLVELLSGEIGVESQPGKGSKFWFMIPIRIAPDEEAAEEYSAGRQEKPLMEDTGRLYHILLVEDNDTNRLVARRYLEKAGFLVEEALDGLDAIAKAKVADFDLILMDVSMPEMDGMQATCHIRALGGKNAQIPIIALTAHVMAGDRELCLAAGMNDYLNKPLEYDHLLRALSRWLHVHIVPQKEAKAEPQPEKEESPVIETVSMDAPDLDPQVLKSMRDVLGPAAVEEVTRVFLSDSLIRMRLFETETNRSALMDAAHTLKSCSANCGLLRFSRLMAGLEAAAAQGDGDRIASILPEVQGVYAIARARLEAERGNYTS